MRIESGYLSPHFVTDPERMECIYEDVYVLIHDKRISERQDLLPLLDKVAQTGKPLLVIAEDIDGEALASLVLRKVLGTVKCVAVGAGAHGGGRHVALEEIATLTMGHMIADNSLDRVTLTDLGHASRIIVNAKNTVIEPAPESKI